MGVLKAGRNCWRIGPINSGKFLIDGQAYFNDIEKHLHLAKDSIFIIGWDFDSRIFLSEKSKQKNLPLGRLLEKLCEKNPRLDIYILIWDPIYFYAFNRQPFQRWLFSRLTRSRIHFILDHQHPLTASHHQKLIVIDKNLAYCGGIDLTSSRWDSSHHLSHDKRRVSPNGKPYPPFHDVSIRIEGKAVHDLFALAKKRWYDAGGQAINKPIRDAYWNNLTKDFSHSLVAISRTMPSFLNHQGIREIERLYLDLIKSSKSYIYIENQYFASQTVSDALAHSLQKTTGPEIIIVTTPNHEGWIEERTMGATRNKLLSNLYESDIHHRLGVYTPHIKGTKYTLHSKIMVVDHIYAVIGSANLNNRSMGMDSECTITLSGINNNLTMASIQTFMNRLLAEHLGTKEYTISDMYDKKRSYLKTINSLQSSGRRLSGYRTRVNDWIMNFLGDLSIIDPKNPFDIELDLDKTLFITWLTNLKVGGYICNAIGILVGVYILFASSNHFTQTIPILKTEFFISSLPIFFSLQILCFIMCLAIIPFILQILIITNLSPIWSAPILGIMLCIVSMTTTYYLGKLIGPRAIHRYLIARPHIIYQRLRGTGLLPIIFTRLLLWLPFNAINLVAGSASVKKKRFIIGSIIGMLPKIIVYIGLFACTKKYLLTGNLKSLTIGFLALLMILSWIVFILNRYRILTRAWHMDR